LERANRGDLVVRLSQSDLEKITGQFSSLTKILMLVILTVTAAVAALFFVMINQKVLAISAAVSSITLGILSTLRLLKK